MLYIEKKMKQSELAARLGRKPSQISDWINGRKKPLTDDFIKICKELEIAKEVFPELRKSINPKDVSEEIESLKGKIRDIENVMRLVLEKLNNGQPVSAILNGGHISAVNNGHLNGHIVNGVQNTIEQKL